jgi:hypothetical protein
MDTIVGEHGNGTIAGSTPILLRHVLGSDNDTQRVLDTFTGAGTRAEATEVSPPAD